MTLVNKIVSLISSIITILVWFFPLQDYRIKLILCLVFICLILLVNYIELLFVNLKLKTENNDLKEKHFALSERFKAKQNSLQFYKAFIDEFTIAIELSMQTTMKGKINKLYESFIILKRLYIDRGNNNG